MDIIRGYIQTMTETLELKKAVGSILSKKGFRKNGQSWILVGEDATVVINLQKYEYDKLYFVNFGIWLNALGLKKIPAENHCHIRDRLEYLFPDNRDLIVSAFEINSNNDDIPALKEFLELEVWPFCRQCLSLEGIRELVQKGRFTTSLIRAEARPLLSLGAT